MLISHTSGGHKSQTIRDTKPLTIENTVIQVNRGASVNYKIQISVGIIRMRFATFEIHGIRCVFTIVKLHIR